MAADTIKLDNIPDYLHFKYDKSPQDMNGPHVSRAVARQGQRNEDIQLLKFPSTKNILWDHTETGDAQVLHVSYFRKPQLCVTEKVLRFAQRHVESNSQTAANCVLVGSLQVNDDGEGVLFSVERLDPVGDTNTSTSHAAGDMLIPFTIQTGSRQHGSTAEDYSSALQLLKQRCSSKDPIELGNFLLMKGWCSFYTSGETCVHHLEFELVSVATEIRAQPIGPVPIVPTALSKNLSGPMSISHMQGTAKTGYLTMDHTRKLLLVLESDPKVTNLPLVGIWISGISYVYSPYVWACCLRYLHNSSIQDRVCSPPDPFLLVLYNPTHSKPEFYECSAVSGSNKMTFDLYTGYEAVQISKNTLGDIETVEVELNLQRDGQKFQLFQEAVLSSANDSGLEVSRRSMSPDPVSHDDITPRLKPAPHVSKLPMMQSMVPEVSLFFGNDLSVQDLRVSQPQSLPSSRADVFKGQSDSGQFNSLPSSNDSSSSNRHGYFSEAASNYVQNANIVKPAQSGSISGQRYLNLPPQGSKQSSGNMDPAPSPQLCPPVTTGYSHGASTVHSSQQGYQCAPSVHTVGLPQNGYISNSSIPTTGIPQGYQNGYHTVSGPGVVGTGPRPYCNCPSCPKPSQLCSGPPSYDIKGPLPQSRPVSSSYGPLPPRLQGQFSGYPPLPPPVGYPNPHQGPPLHGQPYPHVHQERPAVSAPPYPVSQPTLEMQAYGNPPCSQSGIPRQAPSQPGYNQPGPDCFRPAISHVAQINFPSPQASLGLPVQAEGKVSSPKPPAIAEGQVLKCNEVRRSNPNSDSSGRSSDDSGLSFTPEKHHSSPNTNSKFQTVGGDLMCTLGTVNWESVPAEIYQLLVQQDRQLKQLQAQIEALTQQQSLNNTTESASGLKPVQGPPETCTTATNTSVGLGEHKQQVSACMQTSQQEGDRLSHSQEMVRGAAQSKPCKDVSHSSSGGSAYDGRTPAEIRHRGRLPMNSTQREDADLDISQGELVALMNNMHDRTVDSVQSEMIVDLPSFQSSPTRSPRSQESCTDSTAFNMSPRSPISASMCEQQVEESESECSEEEDNTAGTDNPEYYNRLMDNIKKLLSQNTTENTMVGEIGDGGYSGDVSSGPSTPEMLAREEVRLGEHLQSFMRFGQSNARKAPTDTTFIPKINYVSMLLDSDTDTSMEINAMAMKYLKDEQLTQLTKLQAKNRMLQGSKKASEKTALLQKILKMEDDSTPNVTAVGMSPNDLTFATKRYLERHGLLEGGTSSGNTSDTVTGDDSYRLRTNYSTLTSGSEDGPAQVTHEVLSTPESYGTRTAAASAQQSNGIYRNETTSTSNSSRTPFNDSKQLAGFNRTPRPNHVHSRLEDHRRLTQESGTKLQNGSVPVSHTVSPFSQNTTPYGHDMSRRQEVGSAGRYVTPQITRPPQRPNHSPPEREITSNFHQENKGFGDYRHINHNQGHLNMQQKLPAANRTEDVQNCFDSHKHRMENADDDRILDITHLKQLPKLL